ncbi:MAG: alkaline phosphatase [Kiritimatiellia bacterium]
MKRILFAVGVAWGTLALAQGPKNVILFIGDGMSVPQRMVAEEFSRKVSGQGLAMNAMPCVATTRTCSADSLVTDSAAAATAIACGKKTNNHYSGVDPAGRPVYSCAVAAQKAGKKVGICSTVTITHATPAGFYAHRISRSDSYGIAIDLVNSRFDFFAGGGLDVNAKNSTGHKEYAACGDAWEYARKNGYRCVATRDEFMALKPGCGKILTRFTNGPLENAIDLTAQTDQPTVAELTAKAIEILDNEKGFFLMVEGGRIDWAGHANDAATNLRDVLALDAAVRTALDFQAKHPDTLVLVTGDHETGGLSMGFAGTGYALYLEVLAGQTMSIDRFTHRVAELFKAAKTPSFAEVKPLIAEAFGFKFEKPAGGGKDLMVLNGAELAELKAAFAHDQELYRHQQGENPAYDGEKRYLLGGACRLIVSHKAGLGWSSGAHTAMPVLTTAQGPGATQFVGFIENTDISRKLKAFYE